MRVVIYGDTGMVGQGVLREAVLADDVLLNLARGHRSEKILDPIDINRGCVFK